MRKLQVGSCQQFVFLPRIYPKSSWHKIKGKNSKIILAFCSYHLFHFLPGHLSLQFYHLFLHPMNCHKMDHFPIYFSEILILSRTTSTKKYQGLVHFLASFTSFLESEHHHASLFQYNRHFSPRSEIVVVDTLKAAISRHVLLCFALCRYVTELDAPFSSERMKMKLFQLLSPTNLYLNISATRNYITTSSFTISLASISKGLK